MKRYKIQSAHHPHLDPVDVLVECDDGDLAKHQEAEECIQFLEAENEKVRERKREYVRIIDAERTKLSKFEYMIRSLAKSLHETLDCDHKRRSCEEIGCPGDHRRRLIEDARVLLRDGQ